MKIALAQLNPTIGDIPGNVAKISAAVDAAADAGADLVVTGELSVCGYPPRDLVLKPQFIEANRRALEELACHCTTTAALVGFVARNQCADGRPLSNAAALLSDGRCVGTHVKTLLPTYDVFDETRYFEPGTELAPMMLGDRCIGVTICEDLWDPNALGRQLYHDDPVARMASMDVELLVNMSGSPYQLGKQAVRGELVSRQAKRLGRPIVYVNQVGGNDDLIFDGASCVVDGAGRLLAQCRDFEPELLIVDLDDPGDAPRATVGEGMASLAAALQLGLRDYAAKCGFTGVVLGLSGGIDSALVATLAADAMGAENVTGIAMPSRFSSEHSVADARQLAENLGIRFLMVPIEPAHAAYEAMLAEAFAGREPDIAEENLQARARGAVVMAMSNKFGCLPLTTGNKSELSMGYCTLYGDMCGGLNVISDVPKTTVYELCRHINAAAGTDRIPANTIAKPPSAELRPNQIDADSLPAYELLDPILARYVEQEMSVDEIAADGFDRELVLRIAGMVDRSEFKRRQAAPGLKVTSRAFGVGRRMPIAQRFRYE